MNNNFYEEINLPFDIWFNYNKFIHNENAYHDLSINNDVFNAINLTITKYGNKKLKNKLMYCSSNIDYLQKISNINYLVLNDKKFVIKMINLISKIKDIEDKVDNWILNKCSKELLFTYDFLNNRYLLSVSNKMKFSSMLILILIYFFIYFYLYYVDIPVSAYDYIKGIIYGYYRFIKLLLYFFIKNMDWIDYTAFTLTTAYVSYQIYMLYQSINNCYEHYNICNNFYSEYENIVRYLDICEQIYKYDQYFKNNKKKNKIRTSIDYLKTYFCDNSSLGYSLVAKMGIDEYIEHMNIITNYIGNIDCQICIIKLLESGYSIPNFIKSDFPVLKIDSVWNPIIKKHLRVPNSIDVDFTKSNTIIITGPNKSGKSTFMRSIILNIYLSQSLGISCSNNTIATPFKDILSYLNVPDCVGRESLFEAEINRCYNYIEKIESFGGFSIGIIDELFTGTNPDEGMAGSYAVLNRIKDNPINITIFSTHFHDMLHDLDKNKFTFVKFQATKNSNNKYIFDYKMKNGISKQSIALELLKEKGFDNDIINDAFNYKNQR